MDFFLMNPRRNSRESLEKFVKKYLYEFLKEPTKYFLKKNEDFLKQSLEEILNAEANTLEIIKIY